jgi:hypothetical protein
MEPTAASAAFQELAKNDLDIAVALMAAMQPKRAAKLLDQMALSAEAKPLVGVLSERIGKRQKEQARR